MDETVWFPNGNPVKLSWTFQDAAARFWATRDEFLIVAGNEIGPRGCWELTCFPLKSLVGKTINFDGLASLRGLLGSLSRGNDFPSKRYDAVKLLEGVFKEKFAYPPAPLSVDQNRVEVERRAFAIRMFQDGKGLNKPPQDPVR